MKVKIKSQITPYILLVVGLLLLIGGFVFFNFVLKEKTEKNAVYQTAQKNIEKEVKAENFYVANLYSCIDELVKEGSQKAFNSILDQKKLKEIHGLPVVFNGPKKVNLDFKEVKKFVEDYVKNHYYICRNKYYNYKQTKGIYVITDLELFELYETGWVAKIHYIMKNIKKDKSYEGEKEITGRTTYLKELVDLYNSLIDYEYKTRAIEKNMFTFIYHPELYSFYYGYPTTNIIYPCREMRFDLNQVKDTIKRILGVLISRYRIKNTENDLNVEPVFEIPLSLKEYTLGLKAWFKLLDNDTYIGFSVVPGSNAAIVGNELIIKPDPTATLSPSQKSYFCSYDLFYDIGAPVEVTLDYEGQKINFVMLLKINNNQISNLTIEKMKEDNTRNSLSLEGYNTLNKCIFDERVLEKSPKVKTVFEGQPVDALIKVNGYPCVFETKKGVAKVPISCLGCKVYAFKEDYISEGKVYSGEREIIIPMYKLKDVAIWTIYTPDWLIGNWSNESFRNLKFQGSSNPTQIKEGDPTELIKFVAKKELPEFKELFIPILLNNGVSIFYYDELNISNMTYATNGFKAVERVPYEYYVSNGTDFIKAGEITFNSKNYFYDEKKKTFVPCKIEVYQFKGNIDLGKEVYLIRLSNNKVIEFPYYTRLYSVKDGQTYLTTDYLIVCLPKNVKVKDGLIYRYDDNEKAWIKQGSFHFNSVFKLLKTN
jgi:hypothetical protein